MLDNWDLFAAELFQVFGNPHIQSTSRNAIRNLKMPENTRAAEFIVAFNSHSSYTGYNDVALAEHFYRGLAERIKEKFQYAQRPHTLAGIRTMALNFDEWYWELQEEKGTYPASTNYSIRKEKKSDDYSRGSAPPARRPFRSNDAPLTNFRNPPTQYRNTGSALKNSASSSFRPPAPTPKNPIPQYKATSKPITKGPLSQEEKDRRRAAGLCLYCAEKGHFATECPILAPNRKAVTGKATYTFSATDSASPPNTESGNSKAPQSKEDS
jgi:hypothetical protein